MVRGRRRAKNDEFDEQDPADDSEPTGYMKTGRNALHALGIALLAVTLLTIVYSSMSIYFDVLDPAGFSFEVFSKRVLVLFQSVGICAGPIVFILAFALLQRLRVKYGPER